jgi:hypothetical protein
MSLIGSVTTTAAIGLYSKDRSNRLGEGVKGSRQEVPSAEVVPQTVAAKAQDTSRGFLV